MQADDIGRTLRTRCDLINVERGGVRRQNGTRPQNCIELREHLLLDRHIFEYRFDREIDIGNCLVREHRLQQIHPRLKFGYIQLALFDLSFIHLANTLYATVERFLIELEQTRFDSCVEKVDSDTGAHGASADDGNLRDGARLRVSRQIIDTLSSALCKEDMT